MAREWTIQEDRWHNPHNKEVRDQLWHRRWVDVVVLKSPDGRVVEYDEANPAHVHAVANGLREYRRAVVARVRRSYWLGPHVLFDGQRLTHTAISPTCLFGAFARKAPACHLATSATCSTSRTRSTAATRACAGV